MVLARDLCGQLRRTGLTLAQGGKAAGGGSACCGRARACRRGWCGEKHRGHRIHLNTGCQRATHSAVARLRSILGQRREGEQCGKDGGCKVKAHFSPLTLRS